MTEEVEGIKCCYYCQELIKRHDTWSFHTFRHGLKIYYHYRCNPEGSTVLLLPISISDARSLYNYLRPVEPGDIEDWRIETIKGLENILGE